MTDDRDARATPRVDALLIDPKTGRTIIVHGETFEALEKLARDLERALTAATARAEEAEKANRQNLGTLLAYSTDISKLSDRLAALEAALRKPTAEMLRAANKADLDYSNNRFCGDGGLSRMEFIYKAMTAVAISALPDAGKESGGT